MKIIHFLSAKNLVFITIIICFLTVNNCLAQAIDGNKDSTINLTIEECLNLAEKNNVQIKNAILDYQYQKEVNKEITAVAFPNIVSNISLQQNIYIPVSVLNFGGTPTTIRLGTNYIANVGISLSQIIFDGQVFVALEAKKSVLKYADKKVELTKEQIKANVLKVAYQLIATKIQKKIILSNIERLSRLSKELSKSLDNGLVEQLDLDKLRVQLANLEFEKKKLDISVKNGYLGLKILIGLNSKQDLFLTDTISLNQLNSSVLNDINNFNYDDRLDYQYTKILQKLTSYNLKRYQLSKIPSLTLNSLYLRNALRDTFDFFSSRKPWFFNSYVSLNLSIPIFKGLYTNAKINQTKIQLKQVNLQLEQTKIQIDNEIKSNQNNYLQAIDNTVLQQENMNLAEKVYNQIYEKYKQGLSSQIELFNAESELQTAQNNYFLSIYSAIIAKIDLDKSLGKL